MISKILAILNDLDKIFNAEKMLNFCKVLIDFTVNKC